MTEEFSARTRTASLARMQWDLFDVLVIGGGIVGAGIARDAARRGFRTASWKPLRDSSILSRS